MPFFSIIIVSWNALDHLKTYLSSVAETNYPNYEIILADNASTDGSREWVQEHFPTVRIATFDRNYGYCGGNNRAVPHANGDILLFLNNDVRVEPNWLHGLANCFQQDSNIAAAQPKMLSDEQPTHFEYAGAAGGFLDRWGYPFCRGRIFDTVEEDLGQYDDETDIFWASGAALAVRKDIFNELGGFDEDFEFHMEEIDLCWRIWNAGLGVRFCPESTVYHLGGGSMPMGSPRKVYYNYRNNLRMLWKNCSEETLLQRFWGRYLLDFIAAGKTLLSGDWSDLKAIFRAHRHFWRHFRATHEKRRQLQQNRKRKGDPKTLFSLTLVNEYFIKKHTTFDEITQGENLK